MRMLIVASLPMHAGPACLKMFFYLVEAKLRFLKANWCLRRVGLVPHGPDRTKGSMSPPFTWRMAKSCFLEASMRKLGTLCIVLLIERHCSRRHVALGIDQGVSKIFKKPAELRIHYLTGGHDGLARTSVAAGSLNAR